MFKVQYGKEVRIFQNAEKIESFKQLAGLAKDKFKQYPDSFTFTYIDDEGDEITVESDADLDCFISMYCKESKRKNMFKLILQPTERNQVFLSEDKNQSNLQEDDFSSQSSIYFSNREDLSRESSKIQQFEVQQFQELNDQSQSISYLECQKQYEEEYFYQWIKSNLKQIQDKIIENTFHGAYDQLVKEEVSTFLNINDQYVTEVQIFNQNSVSTCKTESIVVDFQEEDENQLGQMIEKALLRQMPAFIEELTKRTISSVKTILLAQNSQLQSITKTELLL